MRVQAFQEQSQRLAALVVEGRQELGVGVLAYEGALVGRDLGGDPVLGAVQARPYLVEGGERLCGVEVGQDAQGLLVVAGGDVGDGGERPVRERAGVRGSSAAAVRTARVWAAASAGRTEPSATLASSLSHSS